MKRLIVLLLLLGTASVLLAHGVSEEDKLAMISGGYLQYIWLGATHIHMVQVVIGIDSIYIGPTPIISELWKKFSNH